MIRGDFVSEDERKNRESWTQETRTFYGQSFPFFTYRYVDIDGQVFQHRASDLNICRNTINLWLRNKYDNLEKQQQEEPVIAKTR